MGPDVSRGDGRRSAQTRRARSTLPSASKNSVAKDRRIPIPRRLAEIRVSTSRETPAYPRAGRGCASTSCRSKLPADGGAHVSSMTAEAVLVRWFDLPIRHQPGAELLLRIGDGLPLFGGGVPVKIGELFDRPERLLRIAVAFEAPLHRMRLCVIDGAHLIDLAMAAHAGNAAIHMRRMVEINVVGGLMDLHPFNGLARRPGIAH